MFKIGDRVRHFLHTTQKGKIYAIKGSDVFVYWDSGVSVDYPEHCLRKIEETTTMDNPFIETVTTKRIKKGYYDGEWVGAADVFLESTPGGINLVIGADPNQMASCFFDKWTLGNLLKMLQEVHDLMED